MLKPLVSLMALAAALAAPQSLAGSDSDKLAAVLAAQPEARQARYQWRHPQATLEFFEVKPGDDGAGSTARSRLVLTHSGVIPG